MDEPSIKSQRAPRWLLILAFVVIGVSILPYIILRDENRETRDRNARIALECKALQDGDRNAIIVTAGLLAQETPNPFVRTIADDAIPEVRGMDPSAAAEWIVNHYNDLKYDEKSQTWRTTPGATSQP